MMGVKVFKGDAAYFSLNLGIADSHVLASQKD